MGWQSVKWGCGHTGEMQLYGKQASRESRVAFEAGRDCMSCWLLKQWEEKSDPRAKREDALELACMIAKGKGIRICP